MARRNESLLIPRNLRTLFIKRGWLEPDADDEAASQAVAERMRAGEFTTDEYLELSRADLSQRLTEAHVALELDDDEDVRAVRRKYIAILQRAIDDDEPINTRGMDGLVGFDERALNATMERASRSIDAMLQQKQREEPYMRNGNSRSDDDDDQGGFEAMLTGGKTGPNVRRAGGRYDTTKSIAKHVKTGLPVRDGMGRQVETSSELERAQLGVFLKWKAAKAGLPVTLTDHERTLFNELLDDKTRWTADVNGRLDTDIPGSRVKASLLNDGTSGGQYLVPTFFDANIVQFPLLHGEVLPYVDLRDIPKGTAVDGASVGNPSVVWAVDEGTPMTPFDATSLVAQIQATISPVSCAIEVGIDFLADAPVNVGAILEQNIGQSMAQSIDNKLCLGSGTGEPLGLFTVSGPTVVPSLNGSTGDLTVNDIENILKALGKQYRANKNPSVRWISNDTTYWRSRGIPVGAGDARRIFGQSYEDYQLAARPYSVQNDIGNTRLGFGDLSKYRLYRRAGAEVVWTREGRTLALANMSLLVVRQRYGGRLFDTNSFVKMTTAPR